jgi:hypothetical protein
MEILSYVSVSVYVKGSNWTFLMRYDRFVNIDIFISVIFDFLLSRITKWNWEIGTMTVGVLGVFFSSVTCNVQSDGDIGAKSFDLFTGRIFTVTCLKNSLVILFFPLWLYSPLLHLGRFFSFLILYRVGRTPWTVDQPFTRPLSAHRINPHRHSCLEWDSNPQSQC